MITLKRQLLALYYMHILRSFVSEKCVTCTLQEYLLALLDLRYMAV
jgi:hypothetical protein